MASENGGLSPAVRASREELVARLIEAHGRAQLTPGARLLRWPVRTALPTLLRKLGATRLVKAHCFYGRKLACCLPEAVAASLFRYGFFEAELTCAVLRLLKPGDTFVDVGAHVGYFSTLAARLVGPSGRIVAFEPTPSTREVLERNLANDPNARVEGYAGWEHDTTFEFYDYGPAYSAFNSFTAPRMRTAVPGRKIMVQAIGLDGYFRAQGVTPSFVKIDAESAELNILRGMAGTLRERAPIVSLEVGDLDVPGAARSRDILDFVIGFGYRPYELNDFRIAPHTLRSDYRYENIVLMK